MALTLAQDGLDVYANERRAVGRFFFDATSDLPNRGDAATWVTLLDASPIAGSAWYVDDLQIRGRDPGAGQSVQITARIPGFNWTWFSSTAGILAPVVERNFYAPLIATKQVAGETELGYWHIFSNWDDDLNWGVADVNPMSESFLTWEIEFVSTTVYQSWQFKANGTWPTGLVPPSGTGAGLYLCRRMEVDVEPWRHPVSGTETIFYRHYASFWEAPLDPDSTQMTWKYGTW